MSSLYLLPIKETLKIFIAYKETLKSVKDAMSSIEEGMYVHNARP